MPPALILVVFMSIWLNLVFNPKVKTKAIVPPEAVSLERK